MDDIIGMDVLRENDKIGDPSRVECQGYLRQFMVVNRPTKKTHVLPFITQMPLEKFCDYEVVGRLFG